MVLRGEGVPVERGVERRGDGGGREAVVAAHCGVDPEELLDVRLAEVRIDVAVVDGGCVSGRVYNGEVEGEGTYLMMG